MRGGRNVGSAISKTPSVPAWRDGEKRSVDASVDPGDGAHVVSVVEEADGEGRLVADVVVAPEAADDDGGLG